MSIDVASAPFSGTVTLHSMPIDADKALYLARNSGRNQVIAANMAPSAAPPAVDVPLSIHLADQAAS